MIKVLAVSHAYAEPFSRVGLVDTGQYPEIDLTVVVPAHEEKRKSDGFKKLTAEFSRVRPLRTYANFHRVAHAFGPGLPLLILKLNPDVIFLNYEPWSVVVFQTICIRNMFDLKTKIVVYTCENLVRKYPLIFRLMERYVLRHTDIMATLPRYEANDILKGKGYTGKTAYIPLATDKEVFRKYDTAQLRKTIAGEEDIIIGYTGRLVEEKGVQSLINAVAGLERKYRLLIIGSGPFSAELQRLSCALHVDDRVTFVDNVFNDRLPEYINCMDIFVLPSLTTANWKEQFGRVLVEAMACEVPVIGSSSGEIPEVIGDAGEIFREGNVAELRQKIGLLGNDPLKRRELGKKGRERMLAKFENRVVMEQTVRMFKEITGS